MVISADRFDPLDPPTGPTGSSGSNPAISGLSVTKNALNTQAIVQCTVATIVGIAAIEVFRSFSSSFNAAGSVASLGISSGLKSFTDTDVAIIGKTVYYWIVVTDSTFGTQSLFGPVSIQLAAPVVPSAPVFLSVSHDAVEDGLVAVHCIVKVANPSYRSIRIYVNGYKGVLADICIHEDENTAFSFMMEQTGETITFKATAKASDGTESATINTVHMLEDLASIPARPLAVGSTLYPLGIQVAVQAGLESSISDYNLYRAARGAGYVQHVTPLVKTVPATGELTVILHDPVADSTSYEWYVTVVNDRGEGDASTAIYDTTPF